MLQLTFFDAMNHGIQYDWSAIAGLYVFAGGSRDYQGIVRWRPYLLGETPDFSSCIPTHHSWPEALSLGASHVHVMAEPDPDTRKRILKELIDKFQPPLNI